MPPARPGPLGKIGLVAAGVLLAACVLAPPFYWAGQALREIWPSIPDYPFHRYFSRIAQVGGILGAVGLVFWLGVRRAADLGIERNPRCGRDLLAGVFAALLPALLLAALLISWDVFRPRRDPAFEALGRILLTACVVAAVEEFLFRGVLLGLARKSLGTARAVVLVSLVFAIVHFLRPSKGAVGHVDWTSGFAQAAASFSSMPPPAQMAWGFATLFFAGLLLAWVTVRTNSLWMAAGVHAGWILGQQGLNWFAKFRIKPPEEFLPWAGPALVSGVVPTGLLPLGALVLACGLSAAYLAFFRRAPRG